MGTIHSVYDYYAFKSMGMAFGKRKKREGEGERKQMKAAIYCRVSTEAPKA